VTTTDFDLTNLRKFDRISLDMTTAGAAFPGAGGAGNGLRVKNNGRRMIRVKNGSGSSVTITTKVPRLVDGLAVTDRTQAVAATTGDRMIGPWPPAYEDADGFVTIEASAVTTVTYGVYEMPSV
jgi:hypothetical protein